MRAGLLCALVALSACKDDKAATAAATEEAAGALVTSAQDLVERREALLSTRRSLALQRAELDDRRSEIAAAGGDTAKLDDKLVVLVEEERRLTERLVSLNDDLVDRVRRQQSTLAAVAAGPTGAPGVTVREGAIATREQSVAERERQLAEREAAFAKREEESALRWKEGCAVGGTTIVAPAEVGGSKYRKRDVERNLRKSRSTMRRRGILTEDLTPSLRNLDQAAKQGMRSGNYAEAYFAADQLERGVQALEINRAFVKAKFNRVRARVKGDLSDADARLFQKITSDFGDGRYGSANKRLNELISRL